jgi:NADH dehydrogenase
MAKADPLDGKLVALIGGSGFLGDHVAQALLARGARLRVASRHPSRAYKLRPLAQLGQIQFAPCDVRHAVSVRAAVAGAYGVVNLVGTFEGNLASVMAAGAENVARAAAEAGAEAMVHVSAIGADVDSPSGYAHAKGAGEVAVRAAFPGAKILRPSVLFGEDDKFVNMFAGLVANLRVMPVFAPHAPLQPLFVDDAAEAVAMALAGPRTHGGKIYEIAGPETIDMLDLHRRIAAAQRRKRTFIEVPDALASLFAMLPGTPMNTDQWLMLKQGNVPSGKLPGLKQLGIMPRPLGLFLDRWMTRYRKYGRFNETIAG